VSYVPASAISPPELLTQRKFASKPVVSHVSAATQADIALTVSLALVVQLANGVVISESLVANVAF
jgi:hypothetical protein